MGQDTYANITISVSVSLCFSNLVLIKKLLESPVLTALVTYRYDEVVALEDSDEEPVLMQVINSCTEEEFSTLCKDIVWEKYSDRPWCLIFVYSVVEAYARNISCRRSPYIYGEPSGEQALTPQQLIENIRKGMKVFEELGVAQDDIKVGYTLKDC